MEPIRRVRRDTRLGPTSIARAFTPVIVVLYLVLGIPAASHAAGDVYQSPRDFVAAVFGGNAPKASLLWLRGPVRAGVEDILGHPYPGIRIRYWARGRRTAWILEEIGKYKPITVGFWVEDGRIEQTKVLIYRESHGWEVRHRFFTDQFKNLRLNPDRRLSHGIDGISGATLSVNALTRLAALALYLHDRARGEE